LHPAYNWVKSEKGIGADVFKRFFGQKPEEEPKQDKGTTQEQTRKELKQDKGTVQEQTGKEPASEPRFNFLQRTRQFFNRMGATVEQTDTITDALWDELEEELLAADIGPHTTAWLMDRLRQRVTEERMDTGAQVQRALRKN